MNKTCHLLRHYCAGGKWRNCNKPTFKMVLASKETRLKKSCHGSKDHFKFIVFTVIEKLRQVLLRAMVPNQGSASAL